MTASQHLDASFVEALHRIFLKFAIESGKNLVGYIVNRYANFLFQMRVQSRVPSMKEVMELG